MAITKSKVEKCLNDLQDLGAELVKECGMFNYEGTSIINSIRDCAGNIKYKAEKILNKDSDVQPVYNDNRVRITLKKSQVFDSATPLKERLEKSIRETKEYSNGNRGSEKESGKEA